LVVEVEGGVVGVLELVLAGVLVGTDEGGEAGVEGAVVAGWSEVLGAVSFLSAVAGVGASLSEEGFILSE
jgi:hypothetical protein